MAKPTINRDQLRSRLQKRLGNGYTLDANAELLIYLDYIIFMRQLSQEVYNNAITETSKTSKLVNVKESHINKAKLNLLRKFRG
ncbi:hypothetical protein DM01DRAFT_1332505 [Hesseltinella vesiculosa]|uniref:Transcription factor CBF/NF-Y/archaeal histone domain-containing protein n=1 Tax=Hesseltinella vesiculosa TaxID=101127 RepID=A0A1X2GSA8_9FUNG|nr:hypothetical protein DM01DRAFT_1332505 [Hesseltinella vesiculosa]